MKGTRPVVGAFALLLAVSASLPAPAGAARLRTAGWWWRAQTGQGPALPPPPHVPPNGLAVGNAFDGPTAISALRFELDAGEGPASLKLTVHESFSRSEVPLVLCLPTASWFGVPAGNWSERPEARCPPVPLTGKFSEDGASVSFDLAALAVNEVVDVLVLPDPEAAEPFEISFEAPTAASLATRPSLDTGSGFGQSESGAEFSNDEFSDSEFPVSFGDPIVPFTGGGTDSTRTDTLGPPEADPAPVSRLQPLAAAPASAPETTDPRPLAFVILAAAAVAAVMLRREPLPHPRLLGPMAGREVAAPEVAADAPGGLGRFRRNRSGEPRSLV